MSVRMNPVLGRELRERMRTKRAFVAIGVFLTLLLLTLALIVKVNENVSAFDIGRLTQVGRLLYETVITVMTALLLFFVPGIAAGAIAGERERQTLLPMQITLLRPREIFAGKVAASMSFIVLMLVSTLPVMAVAYVLGGIRVIDAAVGLSAVALIALIMTLVVVASSSAARRVQTATVAAYGACLMLFAAGPLIYLVWLVIDNASGNDPARAPAVLLTTSPLMIVASLAARASRFDGPLSFLNRALVSVWQDNDGAWFGVSERGWRRVVQPGVPGWLVGVGVLSPIVAWSCWRGIRALRAPAEAER